MGGLVLGSRVEFLNGFFSLLKSSTSCLLKLGRESSPSGSCIERYIDIKGSITSTMKIFFPLRINSCSNVQHRF